MTARTAPFTKIPKTPLNDITSYEEQTITHTVAIAGLTDKTGNPLTVDATYTIHEVAEGWVSVIVDYQFDSDPIVYGNHPAAVGPLRELLPDAYPLPEYPASAVDARRSLRAMLGHHDLGGFIIHHPDAGRALEIRPPHFARIGGFGTTEYRRQRWYSMVREYLPFQADIWWDDAHGVARIRPTRKDDSV